MAQPLAEVAWLLFRKFFGRQKAIERIAARSFADGKARKGGLIPILAFKIMRARL